MEFQVLKYRDLFLEHSKDGISLPLNDLLSLGLNHYNMNIDAISAKLIAPTLLNVSENRKLDLMFCAISTMRGELKLTDDELVKAIGLHCYAQLNFLEQYICLKSNQGNHNNAIAVPDEYAVKWELDNYGDSMYPITSTLLAVDVSFSTGKIALYRLGDPDHIK